MVKDPIKSCQDTVQDLSRIPSWGRLVRCKWGPYVFRERFGVAPCSSPRFRSFAFGTSCDCCWLVCVMGFSWKGYDTSLWCCYKAWLISVIHIFLLLLLLPLLLLLLSFFLSFFFFFFSFSFFLLLLLLPFFLSVFLLNLSYLVLLLSSLYLVKF